MYSGKKPVLAIQPAKQKKSQVSIFLIIGIVIILAVSMLVVVTRYSVKKTSKQEIIDAKEIVFDVQPIKNFVGECLFLVSKEGMNKTFGSPPAGDKLEQFVENNIDFCLDFSVFEEQGFDIFREKAVIDVDVNKNDVAFKMTYPIIITNPVSNDKTKIEDFLVVHKIIQEEA